MTPNDRTEPGVCPECREPTYMSRFGGEVCSRCSWWHDGTGQQPTRPESGGEVKRYTPNSIANEIMAEDAWHDSQWVRASDYDRLQSALEAAHARLAELESLLATRNQQNARAFADVDRMRAKLLELAGECAECGGDGLVTKRGMCGGVEMDCDDQPCPDCEGIRDAAMGAKEGM